MYAINYFLSISYATVGLLLQISIKVEDRIMKGKELDGADFTKEVL